MFFFRSHCDKIIKERIEEANKAISGSEDQQETVQNEQQETVPKEQEKVLKEQEPVPKEQQGAIPEEQASTTLCPDCTRKTKVNYAELYMSILMAKLSSEIRHRPLYENFYRSFSDEVNSKCCFFFFRSNIFIEVFVVYVEVLQGNVCGLLLFKANIKRKSLP